MTSDQLWKEGPSDGYVFIEQAFEQSLIERYWGVRRQWLKTHAERIGNELGRGHLYLPRLNEFPVGKIMPKVVEVLDDILGRQSYQRNSMTWGDGFTVAQPFQRNSDVDQSWHIDGFDSQISRRQNYGAICILLWTNVRIQNGATALVPDSISRVADRLTAGRDSNALLQDTVLAGDEIVHACGSAGDVWIIHPYMMHARRPNRSGDFRSITNPSVCLNDHDASARHTHATECDPPAMSENQIDGEQLRIAESRAWFNEQFRD